MGEAVFESDVSFLSDPSHVAAVVICRTEQGNLHSGLLHRVSNARAAVLHLGWKDVLSYDWKWLRLWAVPDVDPTVLTSIAGLCRLIWSEYESSRQFPYGLTFAQSSFSSSGQLILGEESKGLTCATFVLAVFNAVGVSLVDEQDWPIRKDDDRKFLEFVRLFASSEHFAILEREVEAGCKRIRPDELIGACACALPAKFSASRKAGDKAVQQLNSRTP